MNGNAAVECQESEPLIQEHKEFVPQFCPPPNTIVVDRTRLLPDMVAAGKWGHVDARILGGSFRFSSFEKEVCEWKIFHFDEELQRGAASERMAMECPEYPWKAGEIEHLLAFGEQAPPSVQEHIIVALGTVAQVVEPERALFDGTKGEESVDECVAEILGGAPIRMLTVSIVRGKFPRSFRFLGVRRLQ